MTTIMDVCKLAGVSKATVSRVINGTGQVKESTRKIVHEAMESLQYRPNALAQALASNKSNCIGMILSTFDGSYFGALLKEATNVAHEAGMQLVVTDGRNNSESEIEAVNSFVDTRCDVIVLYSRTLSQQDFIDLQARVAIPIVVINRNLQNNSSHAVCFDQQYAAQLAMKHLIELQHKRIACITLSLKTETGLLRLKAYQKTLVEAGLDESPELIIEGDSGLESGYQCCKQLLNSGVTFSAIFTCNDDMAIGAMRALREADIKVPEQCSVIGIDNEPFAEYTQPPLSSVDLPITAIAHQAMQMALSLANGEKVAPGTREFKGKLVLRNSTCQPK